jgi:hypothetical protein
MRFYSFSVTAIPGVRCSLQGYPVIHLSSPTGSWSAASVPLNDFAVPSGQIVDARHPATIGFRWLLSDDAGRSTNTQAGTIEVTVDLPHTGGALASSMNVFGTIRAGTPAVVGRVLAEPLSAQAGAVTFYGGVYQTGLAGRIRLAATSLQPGSSFTYKVWVTGASTGTALLPGCVGYRERLVKVDTGTTLATEDHELNCAAVPQLPPSGRLFSMQIHVPAAVAAGSHLELEWEPDAQGPYPVGVSSSPTLTVK